MVNCVTPYPSHFWGLRSLIINAVNSGPARFGRICRFHPGVRDRPNENWVLGYPPNFPETIFRSEFIINLIVYHFRILTFSDSSVTTIICLKDFMMSLKRMYIVSIFTLLTEGTSFLKKEFLQR